ncbi:response regulator [Nostocoides sp. HKS02]|uniref:response regulator n=1 Tax=Nostocoides sp. HKS02 TaxID=1813880 RepID=UPI0012B4DABD|nr:response regulator [Tetrasphaera sp. HKS02]QGN59060.1 response regulator [Tetrasphaera sp. HKS02]
MTGTANAEGSVVRRILVVDDDELILEVAQMSLEMVGGWTVTTAADGREGLERARADLPDAIVMDVMMPGMDGPTAALALRADPATAGIPIVLLTAKVQAAERAAMAVLPVAGVLTKPFDPMQLPAELSALLGWS